MNDPSHFDEIRMMVAAERARSLSKREWQFRLRGLGLGIDGQNITALYHGKPICTLPAELCE
ncbi:hypothetical protein KTJ87_13460 [Rhodobacteraceae bacterium ASV31]|nr:hypothetical protein [Anianabacter salinae]